MQQQPSRAEKKALTRERLLAATGEVVAQHGYTGATLDEIATRAGLTKGAVYSNFSSKEELFYALMAEGLPSDTSMLADRSRPLVERLVAFVRAGAQLSGSKKLRDFTTLELEFALLAQRDDQARALVRQINQRTRELFGAFLDEEAALEGIDLPLDGESLATVLLATARGLLQQRSYDPEAVPEEVFADAVRMLMQVPARRHATKRAKSRSAR